MRPQPRLAAVGRIPSRDLGREAVIHVPSSAALLLRLFLSEKSYSTRPATADFYRYTLTPYVAHLGVVMPQGVEPVQAWLGMRRRVLAKATLRNNWTAIRAFHAWAAKHHGCYNPCSDMAPPAKAKTIPVRLSDDEVRNIWLLTETDRERLLWLLIVGTGSRIGEVTSIRRSRIAERLITILDGKVDQRETPVPHPQFHNVLRRVGHGDVLFPAGRDHHPMSAAGLTALWRRMCARAGIYGRKAGPHAARHRFGRTLLKNSGDRAIVMWAMGHQNIETSLIYARLEPDEILDIWPEVSPIRGIIDGVQLSFFGEGPRSVDAKRQPREAIVYAIEALGGGAAPVEIAKYLDRKRGTIGRLVWAMARDGELRAEGGRYSVSRGAA